MLYVKAIKIITAVVAVLSLLFGLIFLIREECRIIEPSHLIYLLTGNENLARLAAGEKALIVIGNKKARGGELQMRVLAHRADKAKKGRPARRRLLPVYPGARTVFFAKKPVAFQSKMWYDL